MAGAIGAAERGRVPDALVRWGTRRLVGHRLGVEQVRDPAERDRFWAEASEGPIALVPDLANEQHYEVPAAFFDLVLGPRRKYSSAFWPKGVETLDEAESTMLERTAERAGLVDGQRILDLGCGWGSFTLWAAERFPASQVVGVSNSASQRESILARAEGSGLSNVTVETADINDFAPDGRFDRIVTIEMLEHVRNHPALFARMAEWVEPEGAIFAHVFAHRDFAYPFEIDGPASWMAETFFSGGVMPSRRLLPDAAATAGWHLDGDWWESGVHYERTLEAWLDRMDDQLPQVRDVLAPTYGDDVDLWLQRWRMFFMACSALFGYADGREWGIAHHRFTPNAPDIG